MLDRISAVLPSLPRSEQRVARLVLDDPHAFAKLPIAELAYRSHVSTQSVLRFCRSVGYDGLVDFRRKLSGEVEEGVPFVHRGVDADDKPADVFVKVVDSAVAALLRLRDHADVAAVDRAVQAICASHARRARVVFCGVGNSALVASDAWLKFIRLGLDVATFADGHLQAMGASLLETGDCALMISSSGRTRDVIATCEIARRRGATVIAIAPADSPLAASADILLAVDHLEDPDRYSPMTSRLMHLAIVDVLATATALRLGPGVIQRLEQIGNNLRARREA